MSDHGRLHPYDGPAWQPWHDYCRHTRTRRNHVPQLGDVAIVSVCHQPAGHDTPHRNDAGETWTTTDPKESNR